MGQIAANQLRLYLQNQNFQFNQSQNAMNNFIVPNALAMPNCMMPQQNQQALQSVPQQLMLQQAYPFLSGSQSLLQSNLGQQHPMRMPVMQQQDLMRILPPTHPFPPQFYFNPQQLLPGANAAAATIAALYNQQHQQISATTAMPSMAGMLQAAAAISGQVQRDLCQVCNDKVICLLFVENFKRNY